MEKIAGNSVTSGNEKSIADITFNQYPYVIEANQ